MQEPLNLTKDDLHRIADKMDAPGEGTWARHLGAFLHAVASYADAEHFRANIEANRPFIERYYAPLDATVTSDVRAGRNPLAGMLSPKPSALQALLANPSAEASELLTAIRAWFGSFDAPHHVKVNEPLELGIAAFGAKPVTIVGLNASGLVPADEYQDVRYYETLNPAALRWVLQQLENEND